MKLSTQGQHAIMAMLALAIHDDEGALRLGDLAEQQGISLSYLEQIFARLRSHGLVEGIRGPGGGYRLTRHIEDINLAEIVQAAEDESETGKRGLKHTDEPGQRLVQQMWESLSGRFYNFLESMTLASMLEGQTLPRKSYRMGETASLIARMFPAVRIPAAGLRHQVAM
ncbi:MAG: Rrf2 family transcriptional regulator [Gammaproteobacteria bacterium]|nr:Rrf2 family transcriptional regulator [Gammaproteobacteria bacterium]MBU1725027.1 Rrf2 family transcriptional regulator [Gammaproteobacteria bacterium]MBU2005096.1 Rrf2 family transcriptional regulator [Gammaproteobacteria bacterium]